MTTFCRSFVAVVILASAASVRAQIVTNGDFETGAASFSTWPGYVGNGNNPGSIPGWTSTDTGYGINPVAAPDGSAPFAPAVSNGTHFAFIQVSGTKQDVPVGQTKSISQDIFLVNGQSYVLSFDSANRTNAGDNGDGATLQVTLAGQSLLPGGIPLVPNSNSFVTTALPATVFPAPTGTYTLTFTASNQTPQFDQTIDIDNVVITAVPEPLSFGAFALASIAMVSRRRRRAV